jgi:hypothetical protein
VGILGTQDRVGSLDSRGFRAIVDSQGLQDIQDSPVLQAIPGIQDQV